MTAPAVKRVLPAAAGPPSGRILSARDVTIAAVGFLIASTTLVSDVQGWMVSRAAFLLPLAIAFAINLLLALSVGELAASYPGAGAIYAYTVAVWRPRRGFRTFGLYAALVLVGTGALAGASEITSGALSLKILLGTQIDIRWLILMIAVGALIPNLLGLRMTATTAMVTVVVMVGLRWFMGVVCFAGLSRTGTWSMANLVSGAGSSLSSWQGGLGLAFWTFVGVETVAPFAEETERRPRVLTYGMVAAVIAVLLTSMILGAGVAGAISPSQWQAIATTGPTCNGECPHVGVGEAMLGAPGRYLMAMAAVAACYGTQLVGQAAIARILWAMLRGERAAPGATGARAARDEESGPAPAPVLVGTVGMLLIAPMFAQQVIPWLLPAALVWMILYVFFHVLVLVDRGLDPNRPRTVRLPIILPALGAASTAAAVPLVFREVDALGLFGRAAVVLVCAALLTVGFRLWSSRSGGPARARVSD